VDSPTWPAWQLLAPPAAEELNSLSALPDNPDETIGAAAGAAYTAARYGVSQGYYAAASLRQVAERLVVLQGGTHRSCWASCVRWSGVSTARGGLVFRLCGEFGGQEGLVGF
jgi:hypothetical protein